MTADDLKDQDPSKRAARILAKGDDFFKIPEEIAAEGDLLMAELKTLEKPSGVIPDASVELLARKMAAEHLAAAFLRDEPGMAPELAASLRAKMASDIPEVFLRVQELSRSK